MHGNKEGEIGWRVHFPSGDHKHVYPNGKERTHNYSNVGVGDIIVVGTGSAVAMYGIYLGVKCTTAIIAAPATGGGSLALAGFTP